MNILKNWLKRRMVYIFCVDMFPLTDSTKNVLDVFPTTDNVNDINPPRSLHVECVSLLQRETI